MFKINCLNPIAAIGMDLFTEDYQKVNEFADADAVLVRSASVHELELSDTLEAIARAGAGVNNIPLDKCAEKGIVVFNTPGANANGVKELVLASLLLASRDIIGGVNWVQTQKDNKDIAKLVEKEKGKFAGEEIQGKKLGIIGLGAIGVLVANAANRLGMEVYGHDPYISVKAAWNLSRDIHPVKNVQDIYKECDFITLHAPLVDDTKKQINKETIGLMKDGVVIINLARDLLVDDDDMREALKSGKVKKYVTDFPNDKTAGMEGVIAIPHLGASTEESEDNCAVMAVRQIIDYMENGNIKNSVNYPSCDMGECNAKGRIAINHKNVPNMLSKFTTLLAEANINITDMINKSKGEWAYTMVDTEATLNDDIVNKIKAFDGVVKVRIIK